MVKKVEEKGSTEPEVEPTPSTAEKVEPTPEEQVVTLQTQIQQQQAQLAEKDESYKGLQRTLNIKDSELKKYGGFDTRVGGLEERFELMAALLDRRLASGELEEGEKVELKKEFADIKKRQVEAIKEEGIKSQQEEYSRKADVLFAEAKTVFKGDDESLEKVEDLLMSGRYERAEARVAKAKEIKVPNEPAKGSTETEEEVFERIARKRGLLKGESLTPSGKTRTPQQALDAYIAGEIGEEEYAKERDKLTFQNLEK